MAPTWNRTGSYVFVLTWLALLFACAFPPAVIAADDDTPIPLLGGHLRETRIVYPMTVQEWRAQGEQRYEQAEAGVSVRYTRENAEAEWLDVYIYPIGEVGTALLDAHMAQTVDELQGSAGETHGRTIRFGAVQAERIPLDAVDSDSADGEMRSAGGRMITGEAVYHTALAIALRQYYFIKGRYSVPEDTMSTDAVRASLAGLLEQLVSRIRITSTGGCGAPFPVVVLDADAEFPDASLAEVTRDALTRAVLTRDYRLLTRDPDDPAVLLLEASGKALRQGRYPGCAGELPVEPDVPEGHREIRIEYRAPTASPHARGSHD